MAGERSTRHARTIAAASIVLLSACATTGAGRSETGTVSRLDARLLAMLDTRERDTFLIDSLLSDSDPRRRSRAALAVGQVRMSERYPHLRRLLVDADTGVASSAAFALGLARDSASIIVLGRSFAGAPDAVASEAAWALGQIGEAARTVVSFALGDGVSQPLVNSTAAQRSGAVRAELLLATMKIGGTPASVVLPWLDDSSVEAVRSAAYVIGRSRAPAGVRAMAGLQSHPDELVRQHVARSLVQSAAGDSLAVLARSALSRLVTDSSSLVRINAARSLTTFGSTAREEVEVALRDKDASVRIAAAEGLGVVFGIDAAAWRQAWDTDTTFTFRRTLATGAARVGSDALREVVAEWRSHPDWWRRSALIEATAAEMQRSSSGERLRAVEWGLSDQDGRVRASAIGVVISGGAQGEPDASIAERLRVALTDSDVQVRAAATNALSRNANARGVTAALDAYRLALSDVDSDARRAALRYLASAWSRDSAQFDDATRSALSALEPAIEPFEREIVQRVTPMGKWTAAGTTRPARNIAEYEQIARRYLARGAVQPQATLRTERGDIRVALHGDVAPMTVDAFSQLARRGFYRNTRFHRVIPNFVAQDGDPRGDGTGSAGTFLRDEHSRRRHLRGCLGVATSGPDTGGSQFYLCHSPQPHLDGGYTVFGQVLEGFDVLDRILQGDRIITIDIR